MEEQWKDIYGFEGLYKISNYGNVKSLNYNHTRKERILKPFTNPDGYLLVDLCKDGKEKYEKIHRLVAQEFLPNPDNLPMVNHKDENKQNNNVDNLEWCNNQYNCEYSRAKPINQYDLNGNLIKRWVSMNEIKRQTSFSISYICNCCKGKYQKAYGFLWEYA